MSDVRLQDTSGDEIAIEPNGRGGVDTRALRVIAASLALPLVQSQIETMEHYLFSATMEERPQQQNELDALKRQHTRMRTTINKTIF